MEQVQDKRANVKKDQKNTMRYRERGGKGTESQGRIEGRNVINMNADYIIKERRNAGVRAVYGDEILTEATIYGY